MLKQNILSFLKSRLTGIIFGSIAIVIIAITCYYVFNAGELFPGVTINGYETKINAFDIYTSIWDSLSLLLFLVLPFSICFYLFQNNSFECLCSLRRRNIKLTLSKAFTFSLFLQIAFFVLFFIALSIIFIFLDSKMPQWIVESYTVGSLSEAWCRGLVLSNGGRNIYFGYLLMGFLTSLLLFFFVFGIILVSLLVPNTFRAMTFIFLYYPLLYFTTVDKMNNETGLLYYMKNDYSKLNVLFMGYLRDFLIFFAMDLFAIAIMVLIKKENKGRCH